MYGGKVIEKGPALDVFQHPQHPYTWGLLGSMPRMDRDVRDRLVPVKGTPPSLINLPSGCAFHPRCPYAGRNGDRSFTDIPVLRGGTHSVACHLPQEDRTKIFQQEILPNL
jgi:peptide/nickel transport system ATP-binding protein